MWKYRNIFQTSVTYATLQKSNATGMPPLCDNCQNLLGLIMIGCLKIFAVGSIEPTHPIPMGWAIATDGPQYLAGGMLGNVHNWK